MRGRLQSGNGLDVTWRARLADQLGTYSIEPIRSGAAAWFDEPDRLAAIVAACATAEAVLPEREPHPAVFEGMLALFACLDGDVWPAAYVRWEVELLRDLGYGLDLSSCASTGVTEGLAYVSPRTGRAVSLAAGEPYRDRLLPLPGFLVGAGAMTPADVVAGLNLSAYFLRRWVLAPVDKNIPPARLRLVDFFA
jgi:DNA repair protein RecO (recombination protein O)